MSNEKYYKEINDELKIFQEEWLKTIVNKWIKSGGARKNDTKKYFEKCYGNITFGFSEPFFTGVYDYTDKSLPMIMFVGQETNGWGCYDRFINKSDVSDSQSFVWQLTKINMEKSKDIELCSYGEKNKYSYDSHAFWNFIRNIYEKINVNVVWNELDKIHYCCKDEKCVTLWKEDELELNKPLENGKSLLLNEIEIIKPDLVVFLTGPNYYKSMESALDLETIKKPNKKWCCQEFGIPVDNYKAPCLWTYHPNALCRMKKWDRVADLIVNKINELKKKK